MLQSQRLTWLIVLVAFWDGFYWFEVWLLVFVDAMVWLGFFRWMVLVDSLFWDLLIDLIGCSVVDCWSVGSSCCSCLIVAGWFSEVGTSYLFLVGTKDLRNMFGNNLRLQTLVVHLLRLPNIFLKSLVPVNLGPGTSIAWLIVEGHKKTCKNQVRSPLHWKVLADS